MAPRDILRDYHGAFEIGKDQAKKLPEKKRLIDSSPRATDNGGHYEKRKEGRV